MSEFEGMFGTVGLGLLLYVLPRMVQTIKNKTGWTDNLITAASLFIYYIFGGAWWTALFFSNNAELTIYKIIIFFIGLGIYPYLMWDNGAGQYYKKIKPDQIEKDILHETIS